MLRQVQRPTNSLKQHLAKIDSYLAEGSITRDEADRARKSAHRAIHEVASRPKVSWVWEGHIVQAHSKAEARGELKQLLGLKRLPAGAVVERLSDDDVPF